ncbi:hypothetical protein [Winogradskyella luteola]|uniref:Uncharacterized protein n=1 Tax=Winogradskyella luteola TaxID=2828330 RepID=A0A9X1JPY3_9FLAO|nr:hypothetical protein [Winogradskyella luteola]MBV7269184.1 hypothetical protein [Winogradskyella luteola]
MVRLNKEQIQFIDNYLENSDVTHLDIRSEMVDHVASGIEEKIEAGDTRDFYFIFKDYMVEHKSRLLDNNKQFIKSADSKLIKLILKELVKWPCILVFFGLIALFKYLNVASEISGVKTWFGLLPILSFTLFGISYFIALKYFKLARFSSIERLGFLFAMSFQLFHFCWNISHLEFVKKFDYIIIGLVSLALSILLAMIFVTINQVKHYKIKFKDLA